MKKRITRDVVYMAAVFILTVFVYWPVQGFDFLIGWDDQWFVTNHYTESGFTWNNLSSILSDFYYGQYAPINQIYYTILYKFLGYSPGSYHILSVVVHYLNCVLVYCLLKTVLSDTGKMIPQNGAKVAFLATVMFAVLPINVEPVSWIAASKVLIYAMFYLLALISYWKYLKSRKPLLYYIVLLLFLFSFGAKEQAVVLPVCLIVFDYISGRDLRDKLVWLEKLPMLILSVLLGIATLDSQQIDAGDSYTVLQRIPLFFFTISEYFTKCILPVNLSYLYPFPFQKTDIIPSWMWIHVISVPLIILFLLRYLTEKIWLFCFSFFIIHIVLVSNVISLARFSIIADRYAYLSSIGLCLFVAMIFFKFSAVKYKGSLLVKVLGSIYLICLVWTSQSYVNVWRNAFTVKERLKRTIESREDYKMLKK